LSMLFLNISHGQTPRLGQDKKGTRGLEKLQVTIQDIAKTLKEIKKSSINTADQGCVKAKGRQGTHAS